MQTAINNTVILLLSKETQHISGLLSLSELQGAIQAAYNILKGLHASDSVYQLVRGLAAKYEVVI